MIEFLLSEEFLPVRTPIWLAAAEVGLTDWFEARCLELELDTAGCLDADLP